MVYRRRLTLFFIEMFNVNIDSLYHSDDKPDGFLGLPVSN